MALVRDPALRRLALAIALSCATASRAAADPATDAFVIAGQSNASGWSTQFENQRTGRVTSPSYDGLVSMSFRLSDHRWVLANDFPCANSQCVGTDCAHRRVDTHPRTTDVGTGTCACDCGVHTSTLVVDAGRGSPWPTFAQRWMGERGREVRFVAAAMGAQCLVGSPNAAQPSWDPDAMDCATLPPRGLGENVAQPTSPGELYCRMLEAVDLSGVTNLRAVLWLQGECDASANVSTAAYRAALERLADAVWRDLGVRLVAAPISINAYPYDNCLPGGRIAAIHDATLAAAEAHPRIVLGPLVDDLELEPGCSHIHDVVTLGHRWYESVSASAPACANGFDDDGDGFADHPSDPGCASDESIRESPACQDGLDGDGDGRIDFDGGASLNGGTPFAAADPQCKQAFGPSESANVVCGLGAELVLPLALLLRARRLRA